jgi:hypothetical protein
MLRLNMMKRLFILSFLWCFSIRVPAQDIPKELLKTWLPIMTQNHKGDTSLYDIEHNYLLTFDSSGNVYFGIVETNKNSLVSFSLSDIDSLIFRTKDRAPFSCKLVELDDSKLVLAFDERNLTTFIPLPHFELKESLTSVRQKLAEDVWTFEGFGPHLFELDIEFLNTLEDSSMVRSRYHDQVKTARIQGQFRDYDDLWVLDSHKGTIVLSIESIFNATEVLKFLMVKSVDENEIKMAYWLGGREYELKATKWKKKSSHKQKKEIDFLTRQAWRIQEEIIPPPLDTTGPMDLGMVIDDFQELEDEEYKKDSTLIISQEDLDNHSLILEFDKSGTYKIYRESRVLDEGIWGMQFNNTIIHFESNRKAYESDGILRGDIEIKELKKNKLVIRRLFLNNLKSRTDREISFWEIYKPIR